MHTFYNDEHVQQNRKTTGVRQGATGEGTKINVERGTK